MIKSNKAFQRFLISKGYRLKVDGILGTNTKLAADKYLKYLFAKHPLKWEASNLIEFRTSNVFTNKFTDFCLVVKNHKVVEIVSEWTTKPGSYWVHNPVTVGGIKGTGCVVEGQTVKSHKYNATGRKKWGKNLGFFSQEKTLLIYRDGNKNNVLDSRTTQAAPSYFGFFIHSMGLGNLIHNWSAGCRGCSKEIWRARIDPHFEDGQYISPVIFKAYE